MVKGRSKEVAKPTHRFFSASTARFALAALFILVLLPLSSAQDAINNQVTTDAYAPYGDVSNTQSCSSPLSVCGPVGFVTDRSMSNRVLYVTTNAVGYLDNYDTSNGGKLPQIPESKTLGQPYKSTSGGVTSEVASSVVIRKPSGHAYIFGTRTIAMVPNFANPAVTPSPWTASSQDIMTLPSTYSWVGSAEAPTGIRWFVGKPVSGQNSGITWVHFLASGERPTMLGSNAQLLVSNNPCGTIVYRSVDSQMIFGCTGTLVSVSTSAQIGDTWNPGSASQYSVGAGLYISSAYYAPTDMIYLGSDIGLGLAVTASTMSIKNLFFIDSGLESAALISVFLDTSARLPTLFWGTSTGYVYRTIHNTDGLDKDFPRAFTASSTVASAIYPHPTKSDMLVILAAGKPIGAAPLKTGVFELTKAACSNGTSDGTFCRTIDPYCGFCYANSFWSTHQGCSQSLWSPELPACLRDYSVSPTSVSKDGGSLITITSAYFNDTQLSNYRCRFGSGLTTPAVSVSSTTLVCNTSAVSGSSDTVLPVWGNQVFWPAASGTYNPITPLSFSTYDCASLSCTQCSSNLYPDCAWCFAEGNCTSKTKCESYSSSNSLTWNKGCPFVTGTTPTSVQVASPADSILVRVNGFANVPGLNYQCSFGTGFPTTPASVTQSNGQSISSLTCLSPVAPGSIPDGSLYAQIDIQSQTNGGSLTGRPGELIELYDCDAFSRCSQCAAHTKCKWCSDSNSCHYALTSTCAQSTTGCPRIDSINPVSAISTSIPSSILLQGSNLLNQTGMLNCTFTAMLSGTAIHTEILHRTDTEVQCATPNPASLTIDTYSVSISASFNPLTDDVPFLIYSCVSSDCGTCVDPLRTECTWCPLPNSLGCSVGVASGCSSAAITAGNSNVCPILNSLSPPTVAFNSANNITFTGFFGPIDNGNVDQLKCGFGSSSDPNSPDFFSATLTISGNDTILCENVTATKQGELFAYLYDSTPTVFASVARFNVSKCSDATTCDQCLDVTGCHYCAGSCSDEECIDPRFDQTACPVVTELDPDHLEASYGNTTIFVRGTGFLNLTTSSNKRDTSGYQCRWGPTILTAVSFSTTHVECPVPTTANLGTAPLSIYFNGVLYLSTPGAIVFDCPFYAPGTCPSLCSQSPYCGWCVGGASCSGSAQCGTGVWQTSCWSASISSNLASLNGGNSVTVTLTNGTMPSNIDIDALYCSFGPTTVKATGYENHADTNSTDVFCPVPPSSQSFPNDVSLDIIYRSHKMAVNSAVFSYVDCEATKACDRCTALPNCGWCTVGNKCTLQADCDPKKWNKSQCPLNKLALGLGLGLGLFFFILLVLLLVFLIRRARKKSGLVITLKEPDYDAIAWGTDVDLLYRMPDDKYSVLLAALQRRDCLLQVALSVKCPATEQDSLAKGLVYVACANNSAPEMIRTVIRAEVISCLDENTLFRSNSVASKMYKFYSRIVGIKYLYHCIARVILELEVLGKQQENPNKKRSDGDNEVSLLAVSMELDTTKDITDDVDTDTNLLQLQLICQKIITVLIKTSLKNIPTPLRQIFIEIDQSVASKFPGSIDAVYKGLGGLFFLRFVCPAITAPHVYGLLPSPPNDTTQRKKEQYMEVMGSFIETSIPRIKKFYDNLREAANINTHTDIYERDIRVPEEVLLNGLAATQVVLASEKDKIKAWAPNSHLDVTAQGELIQLVDDCIEAHPSAPKKARKTANSDAGGGGAQGSKKKKKQ